MFIASKGALRPGRLLAGLIVLLVSLPNPGATQTAPVPTANTSGTQAPSQGPIPPSAGSLMGQLSRELAGIVRANRDGVVTIGGFRRIDLTKISNLPVGPFPIVPQPGSTTTVVPVMGSGFLVQDDIVVTTAEVAQDIINPVILLHNRRIMRVVAKNLDEKANIAIFRVIEFDRAGDKSGKSDMPVYHSLHLGDSDLVMPGELAVTIGNQAGFRNSSGLAFISQTGRPARSIFHNYDSLIQFQGSVEPGCSGSPLVGSSGEVIGIVMAAPDPSQGGPRFGMGGFGGRPGPGTGGQPGRNGRGDRNSNGMGNNHDPNGGRPANSGTGSTTGSNPFGGMSNIGFALPINLVKQRLPMLIQNTVAVRAPGWLGLRLDISPPSEASGGHTGGTQFPGVVIANLREGSPADQAGLNVNDIITQIDGQPITSQQLFDQILRLSVEGQILKLQIRRGNETRIISVKLRDWPESTEVEKMPYRVQPKK